MADVGVVADVQAAVLVADLEHDDGAALAVAVRDQKGIQVVVPSIDVHEELGVAGTIAEVSLLVDPVGDTAGLPLTTGEGSWTNNNGHVVLGSKIEPTEEIKVS